jgi:hypothetical protein
MNEYGNTLSMQGLDTRQVDALTDDIAVTVQQMEAAGIDAEQFIHGSENRTKTALLSEQLSLPRTSRRPVRRRKGRTAYDTTARGMARTEAKAAGEVIQARTANQIANMPGVAAKFGEPGTFDPATGRLLDDQWVAWNPRSPFQKITGQPQPGAVLIPKHVFDQFGTYFGKPGNIEKALQRTYDPVTRGFKLMVLPFSPAWQVGNLVTNAFMATLGAGVDPISLVANMLDAARIKNRTGEWAGGSRLSESGSTQETMDMIGGNRADPGRINRAMTVAGRPGYALNSAIDNMFRSAVFLAKTKKGYSPEAAVVLALRAMGDFTNMTMFERRAVRRAVPFYAWLRHMSQVAVRLPVEHPYRTAWILGVANHFAEDKEAWMEILPGYAQHQLPIGGDTMLNVGNFMPFSDPFAIASHPARNLNPILKTAIFNDIPGVGIAPGRNPLTGKDYTQSPGKEEPASPSFVEQLRQLSPQSRLFAQLVGREDVARYDSGEVVKVRGADGKLHPIKIPKDDFRTMAKWAGVNLTSRKQLQQFADSIIAKQMDQWKSQNPQKNTKKAAASESGSRYG